MKPENIQLYVSERSKLIFTKKIRASLFLLAVVTVLNSILSTGGRFRVSFWIWSVALFVFLCWTIVIVAKVDRPYKDDVLYEGVAWSVWSFVIISTVMKFLLGWGYIGSLIAFAIAFVVVTPNVFLTIRTTRKMLSREKYVSPQTDTKEPNVMLAFVGGSSASGIMSAIFTQSMQNTIVVAILVLVASILLHLGCRYCYKVYLMKKYCSDIVIEHQPEQVKIADRLDDRK